MGNAAKSDLSGPRLKVIGPFANPAQIAPRGGRAKALLPSSKVTP
jgi:hypothetical protein